MSCERWIIICCLNRISFSFSFTTFPYFSSRWQQKMRCYRTRADDQKGTNRIMYMICSIVYVFEHSFLLYSPISDLTVCRVPIWLSSTFFAISFGDTEIVCDASGILDTSKMRQHYLCRINNADQQKVLWEAKIESQYLII